MNGPKGIHKWNVYSRKCTKIWLEKWVCGLNFPTQLNKLEFHSRLVHPRTQSYLSPQTPTGGLSSREAQDVSISHPAPSYQLLNNGGGKSFLLLPSLHSWSKGSTLVWNQYWNSAHPCSTPSSGSEVLPGEKYNLKQTVPNLSSKKLTSFTIV